MDMISKNVTLLGRLRIRLPETMPSIWQDVSQLKQSHPLQGGMKGDREALARLKVTEGCCLARLLKSGRLVH